MFDNSQKMIVSGLQRSGHHAIAVWAIHQQKNVNEFSIKTLSQWIFYLEHSNDISFLLNNPLRVEEGEGKEHFDSLFAEYEYMNPSLIVATHGVDECTTQDIKRVTAESPIFSDWTRKVLVVRDYHNWVASCLGMVLRDEDKPLEQMFNDTHIETYINHCERFLDNDYSFDFVLFNSWADDYNYRRRVAERLGLFFNDVARDQTSIFGGGSSFDGLNYLKSASKMNVNERYLQVWDNPIYQKMIKRSPRAINLSERIFHELRSKTHTVS